MMTMRVSVKAFSTTRAIPFHTTTGTTGSSHLCSLTAIRSHSHNNHHHNNNIQRLFPEDLNIIYDSKCNVCKLEIDFLHRRDQKVNGAQPRLRFTDLEGETGEYQPNDPANGGVDYATALASMHGVLSNGKVIKGVPVFRHAYQAVGLGWLFTITTWPLVSWIADRIYDIFAKYRTLLTRGATTRRLVQAYEERRALQRTAENDQACDTGRCNTTNL